MDSFILLPMSRVGRCIELRLKKIALLGTCILFLLLAGPQFVYGERVKATFAGGCFWCMQAPLEEIDGVIDTNVGYSGGKKPNPSYEQVVRGGTGHLEAIEVIYDDEKVDYDTLLDVFWENVDPYDKGGQFCDRGHSYTTAIFFHDSAQKQAATRSKRKYNRMHPERIVTPIIPFSAFYQGEEYHQDYHQKNPARYKLYRFTCGRDNRLQQLWGS